MMTSTATPARVEPTLDEVPPSRAADDLRAAVETAPQPAPVPQPEPELPASSSARSALDQLSRIEDKAARIEEKYARTESLLLRVTDKLDAATNRMNEAARQADVDALRQEMAGVSSRLHRLPGLTGFLVTAIVTALLTAAIILALLKYGLLGGPPR